MRTGSLVILLFLASCATPERASSPVEKMYVINCGENHVTDVSRWTPGVHVGEPGVFSDNCYLIRHAGEWMLWDTGNPDRLASMPNGLTAPNGITTAFMKKPLAESLKEIGVAPADIRHLAMSHSHGDHTGNANLFTNATVYMQGAEYDAVFGPNGQKMGLNPGNFDKIPRSAFRRLEGDYDVFRDGSVVIKSTPGHTPGHQSLFVRLPRTGPVLLTGDMVHLMENWQAKRVPGFNFDQAASLRSMNQMEAFVQQTGAKLWINHDFAQSASIPRAPAYID